MKRFTSYAAPAVLVAAGTLGAVHGAQAGVIYNQGFESDASGWAASIERVASGTSGIVSSSGGHHAEIEHGGGSTYFGGRSGTYPGVFTQSLDIFIDTTWAAPTDPARKAFMLDMAPAYTSGASNYAAEQNFLFFVDDANDSVRVQANGRGGHGSDIVTITTSGWYSFAMTFRKALSGTDPVQVDLAVYDHEDKLLGMQTRPALGGGSHDPASDALGGSGYAWFTGWQEGFAGNTLAIDNVRVTSVPEPASGLLLFLGGAGMLLMRRSPLRTRPSVS